VECTFGLLKSCEYLRPITEENMLHIWVEISTWLTYQKIHERLEEKLVGATTAVVDSR